MEILPKQNRNAKLQEESDSCLNNLFNFVKDNKGDSAPLEIKCIDENNRYLVTSQDIHKGDIVNVIPVNLLITTKVPEIGVYKDIISEVPFFKDFYEQQSIGAWMSVEMDNPNSFWKSYFAILPQDFSCYPFYFTETELSTLKGTSFLNEVNEKRKQLLKEVEELSVK